MKTDREVIEDALALIEADGGWTQGTYCRDADGTEVHPAVDSPGDWVRVRTEHVGARGLPGAHRARGHPVQLLPGGGATHGGGLLARQAAPRGARAGLSAGVPAAAAGQFRRRAGLAERERLQRRRAHHQGRRGADAQARRRPPRRTRAGAAMSSIDVAHRIPPYVRCRCPPSPAPSFAARTVQRRPHRIARRARRTRGFGSPRHVGLLRRSCVGARQPSRRHRHAGAAGRRAIADHRQRRRRGDRPRHHRRQRHRAPRRPAEITSSNDAQLLVINDDAGTRVTLRDSAPGFLPWKGHARINVTLPPDVARELSVTVNQRSGAVFTDANLDQLVANTDEGAVTLGGSARRVDVNVRHGDITTSTPIAVTESFTADTEYGGISVQFRVAPRTTEAIADGDVTVGLPVPGPYRVRAQSEGRDGKTTCDRAGNHRPRARPG